MQTSVRRDSIMSPPQQLHLKWDDFQNNVTLTFQELRQRADFADVTLVSADKQSIKAQCFRQIRLIILFDKLNKSICQFGQIHLTNKTNTATGERGQAED